jgi:hypothetical protein
MTVTETAPPVRAIHRIDRIAVGERANRDVTGLEELKASIACDGLIHPLILTPDRCLVLGARRFEACRQLGWTDVPAMTVTWIWQALDYLEYEHADPRCLQPLTVPEAMGMDMALRQLQWWPRKAPVPRGQGPQAPSDTGRRERIAGLLGMDGSLYTRARTLWTASRGYSEHAAVRHPVTPGAQQHASEIIAAITDRSEVRGAYAKYREGVRDSLSPAVNGRKLPVRSQVRAIESALAALHGVTAGLCGTGGLDPAIPASMTGQWDDETTAAIRALTSFRKTLRKHGANADSDEG